MDNNDCLRILFIRHAETQYDNTHDRDNCDGDLTEKGEQQCVALGQRLKDFPIDAYFTSSLLRAFKTAASVCKVKPDKPLLEICPELIERFSTPGYYGCSEEYLKHYYENAKMCETKLLSAGDYDFACNTPESNDLRAQKFIEYIKSRFTFGQCVAVFSHHGISEHLLPFALGLKECNFKLSFDNTSITIVEYDRDGSCTLRCLNR